MGSDSGLSTAALKTSEPVTERHRRARAGDLVDLWAAGLALPVFAIAGWPLLGWLAGALIWAAQRVVQGVVGQKIAASREPRKIVGLTAASTMIRAWGAALAVLLIGLKNEEIGLAAALMVVALFTIYFASSLLRRWMEGGQEPGDGAGA